MTVIGLSGYARSGKDTVANILVEKYGFKKRAFADKLREALYALDPIVSGYNVEHGDFFTVNLQMVIDTYGWDGAKETQYARELRRLLQRMGTEVGRKTLDEDIWVKATFDDYGEAGHWDNLVITDMRFPNEVYYVDEHLDGITIRIDRPGFGPINAHSSETLLDDYAFRWSINNNGTLLDLNEKIHEILTEEYFFES